MKILKLIFSRIGIIAISISIQVLWLLEIINNFSQYYIAINIILTVLSILILLTIIRLERHLTNKIPWILLIIIFPIFGGILFIFIGTNLYSSPTLKRIYRNKQKEKHYLVQDNQILKEINKQDEDIYGQINYISQYVGYPIYKNSFIDYYPLGEDAYKVMLEELKKAKKFIFIEYFIIETGEMWQGILDILEQKVKEGVDVRIIYDDFGTIGKLPFHYKKVLKKKCIKCLVFNRLIPVVAVFMNNRDHRKILVIDGNVVFSGGINIADEYINKKKRFGHWKDNGIMIKGEATWNYTVMFLNIWNAYKNEDKDFNKFKPTIKNVSSDSGYIAPYGDYPLDKELVGENIYLNIINQSKKYVYIFTPYLIIDNEMLSALTLASKRGVDVRIVTPGIPDKKIVFTVTRTYYDMLIEEGVKIYEYTPGFIHSKVFVCDDKVATVGTLNLDYRSLYLHFECGTYIYNDKVIEKIKKDAIDTIEKSHEITEKECRHGLISSIIQSILRIFAPLM